MSGKRIWPLTAALLAVTWLMAGAPAAAKEPEGETTEYTVNEWNFVEGSMDVSQGIPEDASGRLARIRETGKLTVATEPYFAPQEFLDENGEIVGADVELAKLIAQRMGVELELVPLEFLEVLDQVAVGAYDLAISGLSYTPGRAVAMELSKGYYYSADNTANGLIIRTENREEIDGLEDLADKRIVAQSGTLQEALMAEHVTEYAQFRRVSSVQEVFHAVENGTEDAGAVNVENAIGYIQHNPGCGLTVVPQVRFLMEEQYEGDRIAAPKGEVELLYFVNGVIDEVLESGDYERWFQEYSEYAGRLGL